MTIMREDHALPENKSADLSIISVSVAVKGRDWAAVAAEHGFARCSTGDNSHQSFRSSSRHLSTLTEEKMR